MHAGTAAGTHACVHTKGVCMCQSMCGHVSGGVTAPAQWWCGSLVVHNGDVDVGVQGRKPAVIAVALHIKALWEE